MTAQPSEIGPYRLLARLGAGAMGEVWRALDTRLDRMVAIKLLPSTLASDPDRRARMLREAKAAAAVPHQNVVALFDIGASGGKDYLVMELVDGRTVAELLREGKLELRAALDIAIGVADALAAAHKKGILHRDVKAANVMLTREGQVKVLDFGLAKLKAAVDPAPSASPAVETRRITGALDATLPSQGGSHQETQEGTLLGTPAYFSPEQVQGKLPDERSEIFTVGVLAYELVAGVSPFVASDVETLFTRILACQPPPLDAPEPLARAIHRALAAEPADRFADMAAFAAALRAARDELFAPPRRRRWPWVASASAIAAIAGAVAVYAVTRPAPRSPADRYLEQAIADYDVFFNDKANAGLRTAMKIAPGDPRPYAYLVLMGHASEDERRGAAEEGVKRIAGARRSRDRALVEAAATLMAEGPAAARRRLAAVKGDREVSFWDAELAFRANQFDDAAAGYASLLQLPLKRFRGRIFDHYVACLLYRDRIAEAVAIGDAYAAEYPGEADAVGVQATVYAVAGRLDEALRLAEEARALNESEDTLAGLAKVRALRGEFVEAERLYRRSIEIAPIARRPLRRAALGTILLMNDRVDDARAAVAPCLADADERAQRVASVCLFVAGLADVAEIPSIVGELRRRAELRPPAVPYGRPDALARILEARRLVEKDPGAAAAADAARLIEGADDLYVGYHLPFLSSYAPRFRAQIQVMTGDARGAIATLEGALAARPSDAAALLQLAGAHVAAGDRAAGLRALDRLDALWKSADRSAFVVERARDLRAKLMTL